MRVFTEWRAERNLRDPENHCPEDLVERPDVHKLSYWLCRFITEVREKDDQPYPPKTIQHTCILAGIQRKMLDINPDAVKFVNSSQCVFREIQRTCDTVYRDLHSQGIGATMHHMATFSPEEENILWSAGVLGCVTPKSLQQAVFFYIGKCFWKSWLLHVHRAWLKKSIWWIGPIEEEFDELVRDADLIFNKLADFV